MVWFSWLVWRVLKARRLTDRQNKAWFASWKVRPFAKALVNPKVSRKCLISYSFPISQKLVVFTRAFCVSTSLFSVALSKASLITSSSSTVVVPLSARTFVFVLSFDVIFSIIYKEKRNNYIDFYRQGKLNWLPWQRRRFHSLNRALPKPMFTIY